MTGGEIGIYLLDKGLDSWWVHVGSTFSLPIINIPGRTNCPVVL